MRRLSTVAILAFATALVTTDAHAQGIATSLSELRLLVRAGDIITVRNADGAETRGKILELSPQSITLAERGKKVELREADVSTILQRRHDPLRNGALWGMGVAMALAGTAGAALCETEPNCGAFLVGLALGYGLLGAGMGAGIDALITRQQPIFESGTTKRVRIAPVVTPQRKAVAVNVRF